jgi:hypothetical protein
MEHSSNMQTGLGGEDRRIKEEEKTEENKVKESGKGTVNEKTEEKGDEKENKKEEEEEGETGKKKTASFKLPFLGFIAEGHRYVKTKDYMLADDVLSVLWDRPIGPLFRHQNKV